MLIINQLFDKFFSKCGKSSCEICDKAFHIEKYFSKQWTNKKELIFFFILELFFIGALF